MGWISNRLWSEKQSLRNITQWICPLHCLYSFLFIDTSVLRKKNEHRSHGFTVIFPQLSFHPQPFCSPPAHHLKQTVPVIKCTRTFTNINNWTMVKRCHSSRRVQQLLQAFWFLSRSDQNPYRVAGKNVPLQNMLAQYLWRSLVRESPTIYGI